ncbi:MAG: sce7726 family protein [Candidatus Marinimicrobia bacterium]|nr:sce7726 family protein [Candidatus Neomarinimicrobiota bacterium]
MNILKDYQIRSALKRKVLTQYSRRQKTLILEELSLHHGMVRIDVAVINDILHGFEIKSDGDTLERLPEQMKVYSEIFDRITLIVGYRHAYEALKMIPDWWGVKLVNIGPRGGIHFAEARGPRQNPSPDKLSIVMLLWREEALDLLDEINTTKGFRSKSRMEIYKRLVEVTDIDIIRSKVLHQFKYRTNW